MDLLLLTRTPKLALLRPNSTATVLAFFKLTKVEIQEGLLIAMKAFPPSHGAPVHDLASTSVAEGVHTR